MLFSVDSRKVDTGETQITVVGEIDLATASFLDRAISHHTGSIAVDLRKVSFMDSTGLRVLLIHRGRLKARGGSLRLLVSDGPIPRLIERTGLADILHVDTALHPEFGEILTASASGTRPSTRGRVRHRHFSEQRTQMREEAPVTGASSSDPATHGFGETRWPDWGHSCSCHCDEGSRVKIRQSSSHYRYRLMHAWT